VKPAQGWLNGGIRGGEVTGEGVFQTIIISVVPLQPFQKILGIHVGKGSVLPACEAGAVAGAVFYHEAMWFSLHQFQELGSLVNDGGTPPPGQGSDPEAYNFPVTLIFKGMHQPNGIIGNKIRPIETSVILV
jgi:hypothetical protein